MVSGLQPEDAQDGGADRHVKRGEAGGPGDGGPGAGSPDEPFEYEPEGWWVWQFHLGGGIWHDANPKWAEPLFQALRDGVRTIRLSHKYQNKWGEYVESAYTIDCRDPTCVMQQNLFSGKRRLLRAVYTMAHDDYSLPDPPPTEPPADPATPAPAGPVMAAAQPVCGYQPVVTEPPADPAGPAPADL